MASRGKKKTTFAKLARESRLRERRLDKQAKKDARKQAAEIEPAQHGEFEPAQHGEFDQQVAQYDGAANAPGDDR
jgi:hypothetical protein